MAHVLAQQSLRKRGGGACRPSGFCVDAVSAFDGAFLTNDDVTAVAVFYVDAGPFWEALRQPMVYSSRTFATRGLILAYRRRRAWCVQRLALQAKL
jgi:hypothetical protein